MWVPPVGSLRRTVSAAPPVAVDYSKKWLVLATVGSGVILATTPTLGNGRIQTVEFAALFTLASASCGMRRERDVRT